MRWAIEGRQSALLVVGVFTLAACSSSDDAILSVDAPPAIAAVMQAAIDAGASEAQLDILANAATEGRDVNEEDYRQATEAAMQCIRDSGLVGPVDVYEGFDSGGIFLSIGVTVADPEDEAVLTMMGACENREQDFVEMAYQNSAAILEWMDELYRRLKPDLLECLRAKGVSVPDDVGIDEFFTIEHEANPDEFETRCAAVTGFEDAVNGR